MTDLIWIISSSVMILAVLAIRAIFGKKLSCGFRYALWALVLIRLLIPGTVFQSPVSVKSAVIQTEVAADLEAVKDYSSVISGEGKLIGLPRNNGEAKVIENAAPEKLESYQRTIKARDIIGIVWYTGMALMAAYLIYVNIRFYLKLRDRRSRIPADAPCRVYAVEGIESSCLFFNTIYVSKESTRDPEKLRFVIAHELSHRRHGDGIWTVFRCAALVLHWYNPLVWYAAFSSRQDSELFADAGAVKALGENRRESYGRTLIELSARPSVRASIACTATTMANNKRALKERVRSVAKSRRTGALIAAAVLIIALTAAGCAFLGSARAEKIPDQSAEVPETTEAPAQTPEATEAPAQTPEATLAPTASPARTPTPAPTAIPVPDDWFIERAKEVENDIIDLYGFEYPEFPSYDITRSAEGEPYYATVSFGSPNGEEIYTEVRFEPRSEGGKDWAVERCYIHVPDDMDYASICSDRMRFGSYFEFNVTPEELTEAGFNRISGDAGVECAVVYILNGLANRLTLLSGDDCLLCRDAKPVSVTYDSSFTDGSAKLINYDGIIAVLPNHPAGFEFRFAEANTGWLYMGEEHPECRYYMGIAVILSGSRNADGTIHVDAEIPVFETDEEEWD